VKINYLNEINKIIGEMESIIQKWRIDYGHTQSDWELLAILVGWKERLREIIKEEKFGNLRRY